MVSTYPSEGMNSTGLGLGGRQGVKRAISEQRGKSKAFPLGQSAERENKWGGVSEIA